MPSRSSYRVGVTLLRTSPTPVAALGLLLLAGATLAGCSPAPEPTPSPTAAFASEEEAFAAAEETYRAYIDASNEVDLTDPKTFEPLTSFTTGDYQSDEKEELSEMHAEGYISGGAIHIEWFEGLTWDGQSNLTAKSCNNVSDTTLTNDDGVSLVATDRPLRYGLELEFAFIDGSFRISSSEAIEDEDCPPQ